jgi:hypothetical protein
MLRLWLGKHCLDGHLRNNSHTIWLGGQHIFPVMHKVAEDQKHVAKSVFILLLHFRKLGDNRHVDLCNALALLDERLED